jgi:hypothetical protein
MLEALLFSLILTGTPPAQRAPAAPDRAPRRSMPDQRPTLRVVAPSPDRCVVPMAIRRERYPTRMRRIVPPPPEPMPVIVPVPTCRPGEPAGR